MKRESFEGDEMFLERSPWAHTLGGVAWQSEESFDLVHTRGPSFSSRMPPEPPSEVPREPIPSMDSFEPSWSAELDDERTLAKPARRSVRPLFVQIAGWGLLTLSLWGATRLVADSRAREAILEWITLGHEAEVRSVKQSVEHVVRGITPH